MPAVTSLVRKTFYSMFRASLRSAMASRFKSGFVLIFVTLFEFGLFVLFLDGLHFIDRLSGAGPVILDHLFSLFFLGLGLMMVTSGIITSYSTMYRSSELPFLLVRPYTISQITVFKFLESAFLSSWAFFFIIVPFIGAYAFHEKLTPLFAVWTLLFSIPFLVLCCAVGTLVTLVLVRWIPRGRILTFLILGALLVPVLGIWYAMQATRAAPHPTAMVLTTLVPGLRAASSPLLPSWWISEGITALGRGRWLRGASMFGMLVTNALFFCLIVEETGKRIFFEGWQRTTGAMGRATERKPLLAWLDGLLFFLRDDTRGMVMKDIRTFLRDAMQWSQFLIFFGLLGLYFASLRTFRYDSLDNMWRIVISFLNIFSVSTVMCSLASRFIYPQLSLEGHSFWILGLAPTTPTRILRTKFGMAVGGLLIISLTLMTLSTRMLRMDPAIQSVALALAVAISLAVAGMSTGLGAVFLDLSERNPAAIVSGFGGTLNLVLSLAFMLLTVVPFAALFHLTSTGRLAPQYFARGLTASYVWLTLLTLLTAGVPLALARRSLEKREY